MPVTTETGDLSLVVTHLLKGVLYRDTHERQWNMLLSLQSQVADYAAIMGLRAVIDESEGYAFLKSLDAGENGDIPRLVARRSLSFPVSLLLALLRKKLVEFDASSSDSRLILGRVHIIEMLRVFLPGTSNEAQLFAQIDNHLNKVVELGFIRRLPGQTDQFEVRRIIKAFVDGQWLSDFDARLSEYRNHITAMETTA